MQQLEIVTFAISFPARRQLQTAATTDFTSQTFLDSLKISVAGAFAAGVRPSDVRITATTDPRTLDVMLTGFGTVTPSTIVDTASSPNFILDLGTRVGLPMAMATSPVIATRMLPTPSPPPSPPSPPPPVIAPPPVSPQALLDAASALASSSGAEGNTAVAAGTVSSEMMWVIIVAVIGFLLVGGCAMAYFIGQRAGRKNTLVQVDRPSLHRQRTPSDMDDAVNELRAVTLTSASPRSPSMRHSRSPSMDRTTSFDGITNTRVNDVRLIELGMAVERTMALQRQASEGSYNGASSSNAPLNAPQTSNEAAEASRIQQKLEHVQAAIDDVHLAIATESSLAELAVRGSPSGSAPSRTTSMETVQTRIRPHDENFEARL